MEKTASFLAIESLLDLCKKLTLYTGNSFEESDFISAYRNFAFQSWYSRVHVHSLPQRDEEALKKINSLMSEKFSPKVLSFAKETVYPAFEEDLQAMGILPAKPQKGMLLNLLSAPQYDLDPNISQIDESCLKEWSDVCKTAFGKTDELPAFRFFIKQPSCRFYCFRLNGQIIGTTLLNICGQNAGIHEVSTLQSHRGRGVATSLMKRAISDAKKAGCSVMSLQASVFGEPVYKNLGFTVVSSLMNYKKP